MNKENLKCNKMRIGDYVKHNNENKIVIALSLGSAILSPYTEDELIKKMKEDTVIEYREQHGMEWVDNDEIELIPNTRNIYE